MEEIKICKDCKHCIPGNFIKTSDYSTQFNVEDWKNSKCALSKQLNLVTGEPTYNSCSTERGRGLESICGTEGEKWEARE